MDMTSNEQKDWILDRRNFSLIRQCKKLIQDEFDCHISLDQENLLLEIIEYSKRSHNHKLIVLARPIALLFSEYSGLNYYRGKNLAEIESRQKTTVKNKEKIIYRGHKIAS